MDVRKTNGSFEEYDKAKLARGIHEAYKTAGEYCEDAIVVSIINNLYVYDGITSREIRRQVEESLMSVNKRVALAYIEKFDAGLDLMVHLFEEEKRNEIALDRLYADGQIETLDENDFVKKTSKKKSSEDELV